MIGELSRYANCVLFVDGIDEYIGNRSRIDASPQSDDIYHIVQTGDRIDLLAYRYLGDPSLWWVICDYNDIFFPLELAVGTALRIPSVEHVQMSVLSV